MYESVCTSMGKVFLINSLHASFDKIQKCVPNTTLPTTVLELI